MSLGIRQAVALLECQAASDSLFLSLCFYEQFSELLWDLVKQLLRTDCLWNIIHFDVTPWWIV